MAEYFDREACLSILRAKANMAVLTDGAPYFEKAAQMLEKLPAADVAPVVHGDWIPCFDDENRWRQGFAQCSNCGRERYACTIRNVNYCPNCGAKMDIEVGGDRDAAD